MHVPAPVRVTRLPAIVQLSVAPAVNVTGRLEDAVAETVNGASPNVREGRGAKLIVWFCSAGACTVSGVFTVIPK